MRTQIYRASHAHAYLLVFKAFKSVVDEAVAAAAGEAAGDNSAPGHYQHQPRPPQQAAAAAAAAPLDRPTCYALELLLLLLGLYWMQNDMGDFVEDGMYVCRSSKTNTDSSRSAGVWVRVRVWDWILPVVAVDVVVVSRKKAPYDRPPFQGLPANSCAGRSCRWRLSALDLPLVFDRVRAGLKLSRLFFGVTAEDRASPRPNVVFAAFAAFAAFAGGGCCCCSV